MGNKAEYNDPVELTRCCGAFCSEYCCPFDHVPVLFPLPPESCTPYPEFKMRPDSGHIRYSVPEWVKENRNRDTKSNLDY